MANPGLLSGSDFATCLHQTANSWLGPIAGVLRAKSISDRPFLSQHQFLGICSADRFSYEKNPEKIP